MLEVSSVTNSFPDERLVANDDWSYLQTLTEFIGPAYGTEGLSLLLHALVRMQKPRSVVEFGTGLGVSAFWMALAAKRNRIGHVWSVDNGEIFDKCPYLLDATVNHMEQSSYGAPAASSGQDYLRDVSMRLRLGEYLTFVVREVDFTKTAHLGSYPFSSEAIDLVLYDLRQGAGSIIDMLAQVLPRISSSSSIVFDSAPTWCTTHLLLREVGEVLNSGRVPRALQERCPVDLGPFTRSHHFAVTHFNEAVEREDHNRFAFDANPFTPPRILGEIGLIEVS